MPTPPPNEEDPLGPVTKLAAAAALSHLEQLEARRSAERETLLATAARVGETALVLSRMRGGRRSLSLRRKEEEDGVVLAGAIGEEQGDGLDYAFGDSCCDSPKSRENDEEEEEEEDPGIVRARFSPDQVRREGGENDDSDGSDWNDEYLAQRPLPVPDGRYLQSLRKGRHPLRCSSSVSLDGSEENAHAVLGKTCPKDGLRQSPSRSSNARTLANSDSIMGSSSSSSSESNTREDNDEGRTKSNLPAHQQPDQEGGRGGLFESAKNWLQSQREKLARLELERQVEDQRRKLVEEGRRRRMLEAERRRREEEAARCLTVRCVESVSPVASDGKHVELACDDSGLSQQQQQQQQLQPQAEEMQNNHNKNYHGTTLAIQSITSLCGITTLDDGDDDEYTDMTRIDSSGQQLLDMVCSTDQEYFLHVCSEEDYLKVGSPRNTVSGMGMSVNVDLLPDPLDDGNQARPRRKEQYPESEAPHDNSYLNVEMVYEPPTLIPPILSTTQMELIVLSSALPPSLDYCKWERIYSLSRDGDSFDTFLRNVEGRDRTVLVVKTTLGEIFGGYADTRWEVRGMYRQGNEFYGTGQACLFRFVEEEELRQRVIVYKWSGANRYVQLCDAGKRIIAFGGGGDEGVFGLCIEDDFRRGTTGHCETFQNEPLCEEGYFDVMDLEVWGFTLDF